MQADARKITLTPEWVRSSRCGPHAGNCVELRFCPGVVSIRDSKRGSVAQLAFDHRSWMWFMDHCRH